MNIVILVNDGVDLNFKHPRVFWHTIGACVLHNVEYCILVKSAPYNSWINEVQHVMSELNSVTQGITFVRTQISETEGKAVRGAQINITKLRGILEKKNDGLKNSFKHSVRPCIDTADEAFKEAAIGGNRFKTFSF